MQYSVLEQHLLFSLDSLSAWALRLSALIVSAAFAPPTVKFLFPAPTSPLKFRLVYLIATWVSDVHREFRLHKTSSLIFPSELLLPFPSHLHLGSWHIVLPTAPPTYRESALVPLILSDYNYNLPAIPGADPKIRFRIWPFITTSHHCHSHLNHNLCPLYYCNDHSKISLLSSLSP